MQDDGDEETKGQGVEEVGVRCAVLECHDVMYIVNRFPKISSVMPDSHQPTSQPGKQRG